MEAYLKAPDEVTQKAGLERGAERARDKASGHGQPQVRIIQWFSTSRPFQYRSSCVAQP